MKIAAQLFTGGFRTNQPATLSDIQQKLDYLHGKHPLHAIFAGWAPQREIYEEIFAWARPRGVEVYLWFPAFAEMEGEGEFSPLVSAAGQQVQPLSAHGHDAFHFFCPSNLQNRYAVLDAFERHFSGLPFTGVFLDRVRYPSFLAGLSGALSCFCPHCMEAYEEMLLDGEALRHAALRAHARIHAGQENPLGLCHFDAEGWWLEDGELEAFFRARCIVIARSLGHIAGRLRAEGLKIGFDVFTPALGWFAGQNMAALMPMADFVKPMLYRYTDAPAGIPYELKVYGQAMGGGAREEALLLEALGMDAAQGYRMLVKCELALMGQIAAQPGVDCLVLPGMETNYIPPAAPVTPDHVFDAAQWLKECGADGAVASWSLAQSPEENLAAFLAGIGD